MKLILSQALERVGKNEEIKSKMNRSKIKMSLIITTDTLRSSFLMLLLLYFS